MFDFLDKFEKRMEWIGVAHSIINRKGKNTAIEGLFEENELTNIIISVLLFIMEKTLEENNECEMAHIEAFLGDLFKTYYTDQLSRQQIREIADYIIKDILQNNGVKYTYPVKNYAKNTMEEITIRLIADKIINDAEGRKIVYMLTDQGYDFLFRMREVDEEIQLTIEQLKLKEYIKRKKFSNAVRQSMELITYVRQKKKDIDNFILSIRQNIHNVDIEKYEALMKSTYSMLQEEYETMEEIQKMIYQAEAKISADLKESKVFEEKLEKARQELQEIHHNIGVVITEQRDLIINRRSLTDLYMDTIKKSFEFSMEKRYDFEEVILTNLERYSNILDECLKLVRPLFLPGNSKFLNIASIYEPQTILKETESQDGLLVPVEEYDDRREAERIQRISDMYVQVVRVILEQAMHFRERAMSEILEALKHENAELYEKLKENRLIFTTAMKLYDIGTLRIRHFFESKARVLMAPSEEFNIEYCLARLRDEVPGLKSIKEFTVVKLDKNIQETSHYEKGGLRIDERIEMSDLLFRVVI